MIKENNQETDSTTNNYAKRNIIEDNPEYVSSLNQSAPRSSTKDFVEITENKAYKNQEKVISSV